MIEFEAGSEQRGRPRNVEAERSVLGCLLLDQTCVPDISQALEADDFWLPKHRTLYAAILEAFERTGQVDVLTVEEVLSRRGALDEVGGRDELFSVLHAVVSAVGVTYHADIVREKAIQRKLLEVCEEVAEAAYRNTAEPRELLDFAEERIFKIARMDAANEIRSVEQVLQKTFERIDFFRSRKGEPTGLMTGYGDLDELTSGLQPGELVIIAARPSMGKTTFVLNIAERVATKGHGVLVFSLEMSAQQVISNMLCSRSQVNGQAMRRGRITDAEYERLHKEAAKLYEAPIYVDDSAGLSPATLRAKCRRHRQQHDKLDVIIIDYLQLMSGGQRIESRQQEISHISRSLKALARELEVPVIALSQLNRDVEGREDHRPRMSDLRECVTGETLVVLEGGRRVPIRDLVGSTPEVVAVDEGGQAITATSDLVWSVGRKPVFTVSLGSGRAIRATGAHRLLGAAGWVEVRDLAPGDRLAFVPGVLAHRPAPRLAMAGAATLGRGQGGDATGLCWEPVTSVVPSGEAEVFDLTVPGPACWLADGIVSHNSGAIEQDADVIMLLHREEYFKRTEENQGLAEIIIAKQRNGPTGDVTLRFFREYMRFENWQRRPEPIA